VTRNAPTILALVLLVATATAFAVTQRLKLEPSPISQTRVDKAFSPVCGCASRVAHIDFTLRRADHLRIAIRIDGSQVTIANRDFAKGAVHVQWDGRNGSGAMVPDGTYYAVVHLRRAQRIIDLPNPIRVDTAKPRIAIVGVQKRSNKTIFVYRTSEPAHALLLANGRRRVITYSTRRRGRLPYYGSISRASKVTLEAQDVAGNRSAPLPVHGS
jgi:hypothetical protein